VNTGNKLMKVWVWTRGTNNEGVLITSLTLCSLMLVNDVTGVKRLCRMFRNVLFNYVCWLIAKGFNVVSLFYIT